MDLPYTGHKLTTRKGDTIHHITHSRHRVVLLTVNQKDDLGGLFYIDLTVDEARQLATSLLRDVGLIEDGVG